MISINSALDIVLSSAQLKHSVRISFTDSLNYVLAQDIVADMNMPPFDKSAVDGYACRMSDITNELVVAEVIAAGKMPQKAIGENQCSQIMTGGMLPEGADCVIMVEHTLKTDEGRIRFTAEKTKSNICYQAEDIKKNEVVIPKSSLIKAPHISVMAAMGATEVDVYAKPQIAIISTGDEIVEPDVMPDPAQIRNSNAYQLKAQFALMDMETSYLGIAPDNEEITYNMIMKAMDEYDLLVLTGGISMGEFDFVPQVMSKAGVDILFRQIAVQPGRPVIFGAKGNSRVVGLPGNPVSSFTQFELLVKPMVYKMMGYDYSPLQLFLPLAKDFHRKRANVLSCFPVIINEKSELEPLEYHGSAHISALTGANAIACAEPGNAVINKGTKLHVRLI